MGPHGASFAVAKSIAPALNAVLIALSLLSFTRLPPDRLVRPTIAKVFRILFGFIIQ